MSDNDGGEMVVEPDIDIFFPENDDDENEATEGNISGNQSDSQSSADNQNPLSGITKDMYTELDGNRGYKCTICHKLLKSSSHLLGHIRTHTGEKPFQCEICNKTFSEASSLKVHMRIHTGERPFECKLCGKRFTQSCNMSSHMRRHESGTLPRVPMHHSHFDRRPSYQNPINLQRPMPSAVAAPSTGTKCCVCEESFQDPDLLKIHEETHAPESPFQCRYCTSVFSLIKNLKAHVNRHLAFDANGREIYLRNTNVPPLANGSGSGMANHPHYPGNGMKLQPVQTNMGVKFIPQPINSNSTTPKLLPITSRPGLTITPTSKSFNPMANKLANTTLRPNKNPNIPSLSLIQRTSMITKTGNAEKPYQCLQCKAFLVQSELSEHIKQHNNRRLRRRRHLLCKRGFSGAESVSLSAEVDLVRKCSNGTSVLEDEDELDDDDEDDDDDFDQDDDEGEENEISITPIKREPMVININTGKSGKSIQEQLKAKVESKPALKISAVASVDQNFLKKLDQLEHKRKPPPPAYMSMMQRNSNGMIAPKMIRLESRPQQMLQKPSTSGSGGVVNELDAQGNPFQCKICFKTVSEAFSLKVHMRTHTGEKPFKCKLCQRQFTQSCNLNTHMRTHTGEKPFTCPFCTKQFTRSASMYGHMQVHVFRTANGIKMYKCSYCLAPFAKSAQLSGHIDSFLAIFRCCICQAQCEDAEALATHQKQVHNKTVSSSPPSGPNTTVPRSEREMPPLRLVPMSQLQQRLQPRSLQPGGTGANSQMTQQQRIHMQRLQQHRLQQYRLQQKIQQQRQFQQQQMKQQEAADDSSDNELLPDFLQPEVSMESGDEEELIFDGKEQKTDLSQNKSNSNSSGLKVVDVQSIATNGGKNGKSNPENGGSTSVHKLKIKLKNSDGENEEISIQKKGEGNGNGGLYDSDGDAEMDEDDYDEDAYEGSDDGGFEQNFGEQGETSVTDDNEQRFEEQNRNEQSNGNSDEDATEERQQNEQSNENAENGSSSDSKC